MPRMKLNRTSLVCSPSIFFFSLLAMCMRVPVYTCACMWISMRVLVHLQFSFLALVLSTRGTSRHRLTFYFSAACFRLSQQSISSPRISILSHYYLNSACVCVCVSIFLLILFTVARESIRRFSIENIYEHITYIIQRNISYSVHDIFRKSFYKYSDTFVSRCLYS